MGSLPSGWELVLIVVVIVLLFGAKKLPDAARGVGRSLRIFKAEIKGDEEPADPTAAVPPTYTAPPVVPTIAPPPVASPVVQHPVSGTADASARPVGEAQPYDR